MLRSVFLKTVRDHRKGLAWWAVGLVGLAAWVVGFYPSVRESTADFEQVIEAMPEALREIFLSGGIDWTSPEGYLSAEIFSFMLPVLFLVFGIGFGSGTLAGEERRGALELLLATPVSRRRVLLEKLGALLLSLTALGVVLWAALAAAASLAAMGVGLANLTAALASSVLLGWVFGALALALGAITGRRGVAIGLASALGLATYLVNGLAPAVEALEPFRIVSPFYFYLGNTPLVHGLNPVHATVLAGLAVLLAAAAVMAFDRRDLAT